MRFLLPLAPLLLLGAATPIPAGRYDVTLKVAEVTADGVPAFLLRMAKGRTKTERKCISSVQAAQGIAAVLTPDPKAKCRIDRQVVADGRFSQQFTCPGKDGASSTIVRSGSYTATGYSGRTTASGTTKKGRFTMTAEQSGRYVGAKCG